MLTWCKLHTDILSDAKLLSAARKGAKHLVVLPWLFAWARAHDETDAGRLVLNGAPAEAEDIAHAIPGVTPKQVRACLDALLTIGIASRDDHGVVVLTSWDHRSGPNSGKPSDQPEAVRERVRRHRAKKQTADGVRTSDVPADSERNAINAQPVTPGNAGNALRNALDIEREKEREIDTDKEREGSARGARSTPPESEERAPETTHAVEPSLALVLPEAPRASAPDEPPRVALVRSAPRTPGRPGRTADEVRASIEAVFAEVRESTERRLRSDELRQLQADTVFAYWAAVCGKRRALLDADRTRLLVKRLSENAGDVSELFYAIDGARRDPYVRDTRGCDLAFMLGNRARVEEFANKCAGYTREESHPKAASLQRALAGDPLEVAHG